MGPVGFELPRSAQSPPIARSGYWLQSPLQPATAEGQTAGSFDVVDRPTVAISGCITHDALGWNLTSSVGVPRGCVKIMRGNGEASSRSGRIRRTILSYFVMGLMVLAAFFGLALAPAAGATPGPANSSQNVALDCTPTLGQVAQLYESPVPAGSEVILHVSFLDTNVEDAGNVGYWALDTLFFTDTFWQAPDGSIYFHLSIVGTWTTYAGALSPNYGVTEPKTGSGLLLQEFSGHIITTFQPGSRPTSGFIGVFNAGGSKADVLLGMYSLQQGNNAFYDSDGGDIGPLYFDFTPPYPIFLSFETSQIYFWDGVPADCFAGGFAGTVFLGDVVT